MELRTDSVLKLSKSVHLCSEPAAAETAELAYDVASATKRLKMFGVGKFLDSKKPSLKNRDTAYRGNVMNGVPSKCCVNEYTGTMKTKKMYFIN